MQRALFQQAGITKIHTQASRELPGHGTGAQEQAINDDVYHDKNTMLWMVFSVLGNVIGGALLLSCMFFLPHLVAGLLG